VTSREVLTAIFREKTCPERIGVFEWFWQDTQKEWEGQGLPPGVNLHEYFNLDVREIKESMFRTTGEPVDDTIVDEDAETVVKLNGWGARHREWKAKPGVPEHLGFELSSEEVWRAKFRDRLLGGIGLSFFRRSIFLPIVLGTATAHHEKMINPVADRCQEKGNCREAGPPAASASQTTRKLPEKR